MSALRILVPVKRVIDFAVSPLSPREARRVQNCAEVQEPEPPVPRPPTTKIPRISPGQRD